MNYTWQATLEAEAKIWQLFRYPVTGAELAAACGAEWWRIFGTERKMAFDLLDGSASWQVLQRYLARKKQ